MSEEVAEDDTLVHNDWLATRLLMRRPWLDDLPELRLPDGFSVRTYQPADCTALAVLLSGAFAEPVKEDRTNDLPIGKWTEAQVRERLVEAPDVTGIYLITHGERLVATASARVDVEEFPLSGYVHWVGTDPVYRGKGLGTLLTIRVLEHFRAAGLSDAVLETNTYRMAAQRTYLRLGFVPVYRDTEEMMRWARLLPQHLQ